VRTIVGLAIVIGVIYGLYWILKQVKAAREETASGDGLQTLATLPLGTNRSIHLVKAGNEIVLVGAGEHGVTPIRTYTEAEARELGLLVVEQPEAAEPARVSGGFLDHLRRLTVIK
jgi:flagellar protein FliO/FliZ